ncbi:hypothetical protein V6N13_085054 [Hibiscus sabdariffa]|uniref:Transmembrane protein n=1 Tax=Hibiscus sabdariffa TaxID=183260 RepID=A0ABR2D0D8_9ROSI
MRHLLSKAISTHSPQQQTWVNLLPLACAVVVVVRGQEDTFVVSASGGGTVLDVANLLVFVAMVTALGFLYPYRRKRLTLLKLLGSAVGAVQPLGGGGVDVTKVWLLSVATLLVPPPIVSVARATIITIATMILEIERSWRCSVMEMVGIWVL